jgi:hypothetical protein
VIHAELEYNHKIDKKQGTYGSMRRIMEISQDLGHRPVVFIRFNPDYYFDKNNTKIKSCWSITKQTGLVKIDNKKVWVSGLCPLYYGGP